MTDSDLNLKGAYEGYLENRRKHDIIIEDVGRSEAALGRYAERLQEHVKQGLSTGDRFIDFEFASAGPCFSPKRVERYYVVDGGLSRFKGQLALLAVNVPTDFTVCKLGDVGSGTKFYLGMLNRGELHLDTKSEHPTCSLPTQVYFKEEGRKLVAGMISEGFRGGEYIGPFLLPNMSQDVWAKGLSEASISRLHLGNDAVEAWLIKHRSHSPNLFTSLRSMLLPPSVAA